jgi:hypothetical protein
VKVDFDQIPFGHRNELISETKWTPRAIVHLINLPARLQLP